MTRGVSRYFSRKAPPGTWLSEVSDVHKINQGDSIASIAKAYDVTETDLRARNALFADNLIAGQVIKIPVG